MQYQFDIQRVPSDMSMNFLINGENVTFSSGKLIYSLSLVDGLTTNLFAGEVLFDSEGYFDVIFEHNGNTFGVFYGLNQVNPSIDFKNVTGAGLSYSFSDYLLPSNNGGTSSGGFSVPSLNGNCASLPDGTTVNVKGLAGDFVVEGTQFLWNDSTDKQSTIIYKLSKNGSFCLVPDAYVTAIAKAS